MDNLTEAEAKRRQLIVQIQELHASGFSKSEIVRITGKHWSVVNKYLTGDPDNLCRSNRHGSLCVYDDYIIKCIEDGHTQASIARLLMERGYTGTSTNARIHICNVARQNNLELTKYRRTTASTVEKKPKKPKADYITRKGIFNYLWMNGELTTSHYGFLWNKYTVLQELEKCIREFREIFRKRNLPMLYLFIEKYRSSSIKELASFANGLQKDIDAVENAVASPLSNGFVEGSNSKVKTIKKSMYGRCGIKLLSAKLMLDGTG